MRRFVGDVLEIDVCKVIGAVGKCLTKFFTMVKYALVKRKLYFKKVFAGFPKYELALTENYKHSSAHQLILSN